MTTFRGRRNPQRPTRCPAGCRRSPPRARDRSPPKHRRRVGVCRETLWLCRRRRQLRRALPRRPSRRRPAQRVQRQPLRRSAKLRSLQRSILPLAPPPLNLLPSCPAQPGPPPSLSTPPSSSQPVRAPPRTLLPPRPAPRLSSCDLPPRQVLAQTPPQNTSSACFSRNTRKHGRRPRRLALSLAVRPRPPHSPPRPPSPGTQLHRRLRAWHR